MSKVSVFDHAWIDLVFEGRNQSYGAYQLRRQDSKTTLLALASGIGLMVSLAAIPAAINYFKPDVAAIPEVHTVITTTDFPDKIFEQPKTEPKKPYPVQQQAAAAPAAAIPTIRHTAFVASSEPALPVPTMTEVLASNPGNVTNPGDGTATIAINPTGPGVPGGNGSGAGNGSGTDVVETSVDVMPQFPGGLTSFYEEVGRKFRAPESDGETVLKVYVSFVVEKDGTMSNIRVGKDPGNGMAAEAIRVLKSIRARWEPGKKKGIAVRTAYNLPIMVKAN